MSTTVSYKGATIATVSNQTKTLLTEGKYLEDDITLVDVSGGGAVLTTKNISANGTYNASSDSADGYSQVNVSVPNTYSAGDEGKVVDNGALVAQTAHADVIPTTSDQTIDTTSNNSLKVKGDANLVAGNIKKDVEIFGTTGSYEGGGGGQTVYSGSFTNAERIGKMDFYAPGCTWLMIIADSSPSTATGLAFLTSICGSVNGITTCQSNNSGGNSTVSSGFTNTLSQTPYYSYANDTFTVNLTGNSAGTVSNTSKVFQAGLKYNWFAW